MSSPKMSKWGCENGGAGIPFRATVAIGHRFAGHDIVCFVRSTVQSARRRA